MGRIQVKRWTAAAVLLVAFPCALWADDEAVQKQAIRLNDITGNDAIMGKIRELVRDKEAAKALLAQAGEMAKQKDQPFNYNGAFILARLAHITKDYDHGRLFYGICAEQARKLRSGKKITEAYDSLITLLLDEKKYGEATRVCREFLELRDGRDVETIKPFVFEQMILAMCKDGKAADALKQVEAIIGENKGSWYFVRLKAEVLAELGRFSDAASAYDDALQRIKDLKSDDEKVDDKRIADFQNRCRVLMQRLVVDFIRRSKHDDAVKLLDQLMKTDVTFAPLKGEVLRDEGKLDEAAKALNWAIEQLQKSDKKLDDKVKKNLIERARYVLSGVYTDLNEIQKAAGELEALLKENPDNSTYNNDLGYIWADHDMKLDESEKLIRKALDLDKEERQKAKDAGLIDAASDAANAAYLDSMGWVLYKKKQYAEAKKFLLDASKLEEGKHVEIFDHLADVHMALGEKAEAIALWKKALELENISKRDSARKEVVRKKLEKEMGVNP